MFSDVKKLRIILETRRTDIFELLCCATTTTHAVYFAIFTMSWKTAHVNKKQYIPLSLLNNES